MQKPTNPPRTPLFLSEADAQRMEMTPFRRKLNNAVMFLLLSITLLCWAGFMLAPYIRPYWQ